MTPKKRRLRAESATVGGMVGPLICYLPQIHSTQRICLLDAPNASRQTPLWLLVPLMGAGRSQPAVLQRRMDTSDSVETITENLINNSREEFVGSAVDGHGA